MPRKRQAFEKLLLEAIDETLTSLGESVEQSIYFHLENKFKIAKNEIPYHIRDFTDGIEKIFGVGANFIEISIMKNLFEKIGHPLEWNQNRKLAFIEYVAAAKQSYLKKKVKAIQT